MPTLKRNNIFGSGEVENAHFCLIWFLILRKRKMFFIACCRHTIRQRWIFNNNHVSTSNFDINTFVTFRSNVYEWIWLRFRRTVDFRNGCWLKSWRRRKTSIKVVGKLSNHRRHCRRWVVTKTVMLSIHCHTFCTLTNATLLMLCHACHCDDALGPRDPTSTRPSWRRCHPG